MGITSPTNRHGATYDYFYCLNRQKRRSCDQPFVSITKVEKQVEDFCRSVRFPKVDLDTLRAELLVKIETELGSTSKHVPAQKRRIAALERERKKLLQAFYADAIPQELLREEQARISREIAEAECLIDDNDLQAERATQFLEDLLRELARSQAQSVDVPAARSEADATAQKSVGGEDGPMYLRHVGAVAAGLCSPLSTYLHKITETTNPRRYRQDEGLNLITLVDLTRQHKNQTLLVEGSEITIRPIGVRRVTGGSR
jgi:polyhydroxyalkanoate synthesis regulator phasin